MERDPVKIVLAIVLALYFLWCAYDPFNAVFLHGVNLAIHETGHLLFRPFGEFLMVAGGSIFQVLMPLVFFGYFLWNDKPYSAAIVLFWVGQSITDVSVYAADAVVMQLMLTSGLTGSEGGFHDWNYLLSATGLLGQTKVIAGLIRFSGTAIIILGAVGAFLYATKGEKILSDFSE
ncbi:MAG: hypothetical protein ABI954_13700 [Pyrinomonadaceae bacterium]